MSGINKLSDDHMISAHDQPHERMEMKRKINEIIDKLDEVCEEVYRLGQNGNS